MSLPETIVNHKELADAPEIEEGRPSTPGEIYPVLKSIVEDCVFCQIAVSTRNEPSTGRPLKRGVHPRYQTRLEEARAKLQARLKEYEERYGAEAAAEMYDYIKAADVLEDTPSSPDL